MRQMITTIFLCLCTTIHAQQGRWKPFKLLVIQPDTALIDKSLYSERDSVEADNLRSYYSTLKRYEDLANYQSTSKESEGAFKETRERLKKELPLMRDQEERVKKFRYYQTISQYSTQVYNFYFNEYKPFSTIYEAPDHRTDLVSLKSLADSSNADYIVFYKNIHTDFQDQLPVLKLTTALYSRKENKIILSKETSGDTNSRGEMWTCDSNIMLSCLLINGVRTSTEVISNVLRQKQLDRK